MKRPLQASRDLACAIAELPAERRLRALRDVVDTACRLDGIAKVAALHVSAEVVTILRETRAVEFGTTTLEHSS
jgi:hypothetical protein